MRKQSNTPAGSSPSTAPPPIGPSPRPARPVARSTGSVVAAWTDERTRPMTAESRTCHPRPSESPALFQSNDWRNGA